MLRTALSVSALLSIACSFASCTSEATTTPAPDWRTPPLGLAPVEAQFMVPEDNPLSDAKIALGKQ